MLGIGKRPCERSEARISELVFPIMDVSEYNEEPGTGNR